MASSAPLAVPLKAGAAYFALIFALGFVMGTIRTVWGVAAIGEEAFLFVEIPAILIASWLAARWLTRRHGISRGGPALVMGAAAFALLMAAELALAALLSGGSLSGGAAAGDWLASLTSPSGIYGFAGQLAYALIPWAVVRTRRS